MKNQGEQIANSITVAVCTRNRAMLLSRTLEALAQQVSAQNFELLLVDNGSTDNTRQVFDTYQQYFQRAVYAIEPNLGIAWARNRAAEVASGVVLVYIDDDAIPASDWLVRLVAPFTDELPQPACVTVKLISIGSLSDQLATG